jgi:hypothetical protein
MMTAIPDDVPALIDIDVGLVTPNYRAYPVADHIADNLTTALSSEARRRDLELPDHLPDPPGIDWRAGYARTVKDAPNLPDRDLDSALHTVRAMLDPVLAATQPGTWDPASLSWR